MNDLKGITTMPSPFSVRETIDRLVAFLRQHSVTLYARIDQQAEMAKTGQQIQPIEMILFGNPKGGGPIMTFSPVAALELPLKILSWEDDQKKTWIAFNDTDYIRDRYGIPDALMSPLNLAPVVNNALAGGA